MYKGKFVSELSMNDVKEYYEELRQKYPHTEEQRADFNILKEKLIAFAYKILDGKTNGDMVKAMFPNLKWCLNGNNEVFTVNQNIVRLSLDWWNAPYKEESENKK